MHQRGRKSAAALSVVAGRIDAVQRPEPPAELTEEQAEIWRATVGALRPDWFPRETHALLVQYCRHVTHARHIAGLLEATDLRTDLARFDKLSAMHCRESGMLAMLSTRMRLSQQATRDEKTRKREEYTGPKPWEIHR